MPVIKVWCLPPDQTEEQLNTLHEAIVAAVVGVRELGLKDETEMTCLYPSDLMLYGLGEEIIIEVGMLMERPERTPAVRQRLAGEIGQAVKRLYPESKVECAIDPPFNQKNGFWASRFPATPGT